MSNWISAKKALPPLYDGVFVKYKNGTVGYYYPAPSREKCSDISAWMPIDCAFEELRYD